MSIPTFSDAETALIESGGRTVLHAVLQQTIDAGGRGWFMFYIYNDNGVVNIKPYDGGYLRQVELAMDKFGYKPEYMAVLLLNKYIKVTAYRLNPKAKIVIDLDIGIVTIQLPRRADNVVLKFPSVNGVVPSRESIGMNFTWSIA